MSCPCGIGDSTNKITLEGLETERPRLVRAVSRTESVRSPLPKSVSRVGIAANGRDGTNATPGGSGTTVHPKGILRQPTKEFPVENKDEPRPHITKKSPRRIESGASPDSTVPASDVVKVRAYRRGLPLKQDRDSTLTWDKVSIGDGDMLLGKMAAPESGSEHHDNSNDNNNNNASAGKAQW